MSKKEIPFAFHSIEIVTRHQSVSERATRNKHTCSKNGSLTWRGLEQSCVGCGREGGVLKGCDGHGRIVGGLGAIWKWWPIKVYKPCPEIYKNGGAYQRAGQTLDELFGRDKSVISNQNNSENKNT